MYAVRCAREGRVAVNIERVDSGAAARFCVAQRVGLIQGPLFQRDAMPIVREFTVGEVRCLALVARLTADEIDLNRLTQVIGSDPELTMRVLRPVNSSACGSGSRIDSGRRAAVMLGPRLLTSVAMMSLVGARMATLTGLWYMLTRAVACRSLAREASPTRSGSFLPSPPSFGSSPRS